MIGVFPEIKPIAAADGGEPGSPIGPARNLLRYDDPKGALAQDPALGDIQPGGFQGRTIPFPGQQEPRLSGDEGAIGDAIRNGLWIPDEAAVGAQGLPVQIRIEEGPG